MRISLVEAFLADLFETEGAHHGVEEDFEEVHVVTISAFHDLDPLNGDSVLLSFMLRLVNR